MAKFYSKRKSAVDISGIAIVLSLMAILLCGVVSCHSHLVGDTTDDFEHANEQNYTSNHLQNAGNLYDKEHGHFHDFDDAYNHDFDDSYNQGASVHQHDNEAFDGIENGHESYDLDKHRLAVMIGHIDEDNDGFVTLEEMKNWIRFTREKITTKSVEKQWREYNEDRKDQIGWEKYRQIVYGFLNDKSKGENDHVSHEDIEAYSEMERMDKQRWDHADENGDGFLTKLLFGHYLYPNFEDSMDQDMIVQDAVADMDVDRDGKVSLDEYIGTIDNEVAEGEESDWEKLASEKFHEVRDLNGDGFLDKEEVRLWILPSDFDPITTEAKYLIQESDSNSDGMVTMDEVLETYDLFDTDTIYSNTGTGHDEL